MDSEVEREELESEEATGKVIRLRLQEAQKGVDRL